MDLIIDIGNTKAKIAIFENDNIVLRRAWKNLSIERVEKLVKAHSIKRSIISSVVDTDPELIKFLDRHTRLVKLNHKTKLPISVKYKTPTTLGADRIANAVASNALFPNHHVLAIDAGTCIKYDLVDDQQCYHGGAISPGVTMRYKALNTFTDKLPLVQRSDQGIWLGQTTEESIQTGVEHGAVQEVKGFIESYEKEFPKLKVIMTGGDASFFESRLKKQIFATRIISEPNLLVNGLHIILSYNA